MNYQNLMNEFQMITSTDAQTAERMLQKAKWNVELALELFFSEGDSIASPTTHAKPTQQPQQSQPPQNRPQLGEKQPSGLNQASKLIAEHVLGNGACLLQVRHGDMTEEATDAIVNAANGRLDHASGLAGAISKKGL
jgi:hypothetical protein